jgi:hypothetical protein
MARDSLDRASAARLASTDDSERGAEDAKTVLLIDYPRREVPETLARAGYEVVVEGGPQPKDYFGFTVEGDHVSQVRLGLTPEHADIVYVYRPAEELPETVEQARRIGAGLCVRGRIGRCPQDSGRRRTGLCR